MTVKDSLDASMGTAIRHYKSLFTLPRYRIILLLLSLTCIFGGFLFTVPFISSVNYLISTFIFMICLFFITLFFDISLKYLFFKDDPVYTLRRISALSLICLGVWFFFGFIGVATSLSLDISWWLKFCLFGSSVVLIFRSIVIFSTATLPWIFSFFSSIIQPFSYIFLVFLLYAKNFNFVYFNFLIFLVFSTMIGVMSVSLFLTFLNRLGLQTIGFPSIAFFKAFLLNWVADLNNPIEKILEKLGENKDVDITMIKFQSGLNPKGFVIVPSIHPGPFKNVGSSDLPFIIKQELEKRSRCFTGVCHGLFGHEYDLASQIQNRKVLNELIGSLSFDVSEVTATPFVVVKNDLATAGCQIFGDSAFISLTLAPKTTEDLPRELGSILKKQTTKHGLKSCAIVNAHNSIDGVINMNDALPALIDAATACFDKAASLKQINFKLGVASISATPFNLKDGMGRGGITVFIFEVATEKNAYVILDGNNMITGIRERIISALNSLNISKTEVFTSDTHSVNALVVNDRGYHPIGEKIDPEKLIAKIKTTTIKALSNLEYVSVGFQQITIRNIKVIGAETLDVLCLLIDKTIKRSKKIIFPIFGLSGLFLALLVSLL